MGTEQRPEAVLVAEPAKYVSPNQIWAKVVAANGATISLFSTLYNDERDLRRAVELTYIACGDYLDQHPVREVVRVSEDDES